MVLSAGLVVCFCSLYAFGFGCDAFAGGDWCWWNLTHSLWKHEQQLSQQLRVHLILSSGSSGGWILSSSQSLCLFQFCNPSGFCFKAGCLSYITRELWDLININRAHYGKLAIDRSFFKRWNHNNNDESICVAWILRAAPACSSVFAFHYSYFPPTLWKMNFKRG